METNIWLRICPAGFSATANICLPDSSPNTLEFTLEGLSQVISGSNGASAISGKRATNVQYEESDPIPSQNRGRHFSGKQYFRLSFPNMPFLIAPETTFAAWIRPQGAGTIFSKKNCVDVFTVRLTSGLVEFRGGYQPVTLSIDLGIGMDKWVYLVLILEYDEESELTSVSFFKDGAYGGVLVSDFYVRDIDTTVQQYIGATPELEDYYTGFIWRVTITNAVVDPAAIAAAIASPGCPIDIAFCLSSCGYLENIQCKTCAPACIYGCVRTTDCSFCASRMCTVCDHFGDNPAQMCSQEDRRRGKCACLAGGLSGL